MIDNFFFCSWACSLTALNTKHVSVTARQGMIDHGVTAGYIPPSFLLSSHCTYPPPSLSPCLIFILYCCLPLFSYILLPTTFICHWRSMVKSNPFSLCDFNAHLMHSWDAAQVDATLIQMKKELCFKMTPNVF